MCRRVVTPSDVVQGLQKAVVAETAPTSSADSSASVAHSAGTSGDYGPCRKKRSDFEEQAELVDVLNMLSQMYRDQVRSLMIDSFHSPPIVWCLLITTE